MHRPAPSRPAPAPPPCQSTVPGASSNPHRYTPTTNWDDSPFDTLNNGSRKVPPPRPPPPRVQPSPVEESWNNNTSTGSKGKGLAMPFKKATPQSVNILSNLFGRGASSKSGGGTGTGAGPMKLPPPPQAAQKHHHQINGQANRVSTLPLQSSSSMSSVSSAARNPAATAELIDWSSPPSSPTLTHKTYNSDCISVDSFGSETNSNSSPQNGSYSQAESGFEDDFSMGQRPPSTGIQDFRRVSNQITLMDPFSAPPLVGGGFNNSSGSGPAAKIRTVPPPIAQKPKIVEQSAFYTQNSISFQAAKPFDDPLSNGKSLIAPPTQSSVSMPTIIKPMISAKPIVIPQKDMRFKGTMTMNAQSNNLMKRNSTDEEEKTPSPPMPNCAPPPPPPEYYAMTSHSVGVEGMIPEEEEEEPRESYGIALYDYESEHEGDLNFRANEKIYLVRQENEEWIFGRSKRGCEGLLPVNYIEIKVPLKTTTTETTTTTVKKQSNTTGSVQKGSTSSMVKSVVEEKTVERMCRALYDFNAEAAEDLSIREGEIITVVGAINEEWLLGRKKNGTQGQFPAAFVEYL